MTILCADIKIVNEYDLEIPQSQTADKPVASRGRATQHKKFCLTRPMDMKCVYFEYM